MKLFIFASAGGSASSYLKWSKYFDDSITVVPIDLAGRGIRSSESFYPDMKHLIADVYEKVISQTENEPFAMMGHSFGCDIIYEIIPIDDDISKLSQKHNVLESDLEISFNNTTSLNDNREMPVHLFMFGNTPPFSMKLRMKISHLPNKEFLKAMEFFGGIQPQLYEFPDVLDYFCNIMRADMRLVEEYEDDIKLISKKKWDVPVSAFCGKQDNTFDHSLLSDWDKCTSQPCNYFMLEGGHFFLDDNIEFIASQIENSLLKQEKLLNE